jgi:hypothetical protein
MAAVVIHFSAKENTEIQLAVTAARWGNIKLAKNITAGLGWHTNCMALKAATAKHLSGLLFYMHTVAYRIMKYHLSLFV